MTQPAPHSALSQKHQLARFADDTLDLEIQGLQALRASFEKALAVPYAHIVSLLLALKGRVIVSGIGKSGHVAHKVAATLASTGTPAFFVHPSEAGHGDLGMITPDDALICLSWSGETQELLPLIAYTQRFDVPLIAITSGAESALARVAEHVLLLPKVREACPHQLAPTTSTLMQMALGDVLSLSLLRMRGFTPEDFKIIHPGGRLGACLRYVRDVMHTGKELPCIASDVKMKEALIVMSEKRFGCLCVCSSDSSLIGIITDGDLRRHMGADFLERTTSDIMTCTPKTVAPTLPVMKALDIMNKNMITTLCVVEEEKFVGLLHIHDLLRLGI